MGQDILLRIIAATGTTMKLALLATILGALVGFTLGAVSAVLPPRPRKLLVRIIDAFVAFPAILVAIFVGVIIGPGQTGAWLGVGIALSFSMARVASTLASSIGGQEFIAASRVLGVSRLRQFLKYVVPNIAETLFVIVSVSISSAIVFISSLSFLGLGVQPPNNDWGRMLIEGVQSFYTNGAAALGPAGAILLCALAFGYLGEALARTMNPRLWTEQPSRRSRTVEASVGALEVLANASIPMMSMVGAPADGSPMTVFRMTSGSPDSRAWSATPATFQTTEPMPWWPSGIWWSRFRGSTGRWTSCVECRSRSQRARSWPSWASRAAARR